MATEEAFKNFFLSPLMECYGAQKFPNVRNKLLWSRVKSFPDQTLKQCADKIILNFDQFPGVQGILNTCAEVAGEFGREEAEKLKSSISCYKCNSHGVVQVNNYAYRCICKLGDLLYPSFPKYEGQLSQAEILEVQEDGTRIIENNVYKFISPKSKNIKDFSFIIKERVEALPKKQETAFKKAFSEFGGDIA